MPPDRRCPACDAAVPVFLVFALLPAPADASSAVSPPMGSPEIVAADTLILDGGRTLKETGLDVRIPIPEGLELEYHHRHDQIFALSSGGGGDLTGSFLTEDLDDYRAFGGAAYYEALLERVARVARTTCEDRAPPGIECRSETEREGQTESWGYEVISVRVDEVERSDGERRVLRSTGPYWMVVLTGNGEEATEATGLYLGPSRARELSAEEVALVEELIEGLHPALSWMEPGTPPEPADSRPGVDGAPSSPPGAGGFDGSEELAVVVAGGFIPVRAEADPDAGEVGRFGDGVLVRMTGGDAVVDGAYWLELSDGTVAGWVPQSVLALQIDASSSAELGLFAAPDPSFDGEMFVVAGPEGTAFVPIERNQEVRFTESLRHYALATWDGAAGHWRVGVHRTFGRTLLHQATYHCVLEWDGDVLVYDAVVGRDDEGFLVTEERRFDAAGAGPPEC